MLSHILLSFYRSAQKQPLYTVLNMLGLGVGIAVFITLMLVVDYERGFDRWIPDASHIDRLDTTWTLPGLTPNELAFSNLGVLDQLKSDLPQVDAGTRMLDQRVVVSAGPVSERQLLNYVDANFLDVIRLPMLAGIRAHALDSASSAVVTEATAMKYFGTVDAVGRNITVGQGASKRLYTVSAVTKNLPPASSLDISMLLPLPPATEAHFSRDWGETSGTTWLRFRNQTDADSVSAGLRAFVDRHAGRTSFGLRAGRASDVYALSLVPLPDLHFHDVSVTGGASGTDRRLVYGLGVLAALALFMAVVNYVNLATARASLRAREVGLRKVVGATRLMLVVQFLVEAIVLVSIAALIGLALVELAVPVVNAIGGWSIRIAYGSLLPLLGMVVLAVGLGAGIYPAVVLSGHPPATSLAGSKSSSGGRVGAALRSNLVLLQFVAAITISICTLVIGAQAEFVRLADRGFDRQGLILVLSLSAGSGAERQAAILDRFRQIPGVVMATESDRVPNDLNQNDTTVERPGLLGQQPSLGQETVAADYFATYGIQVLAGRTFDPSHRSDDIAMAPAGELKLGTVINERALSALGYASPQAAVGQHFRVGRPNGRGMDLTIIGVVQNVRFASPRAPVQPSFYLENTRSLENAPAVVRFRGVSRDDVVQRLKAALREVAPDEPFRAQLVEDRLSSFYRPDEQRARLFAIGAALAISIACLGLFGLATFSAARRTQEIGIRKVPGASTRDVLLLLIGQFIRPVLLACLLAAPLSWVAMRSWLSAYDQRIALSPGYFLAAMVGALVISVVTVSGQSWSVARSEPARALRYE